MGYTMVEYCIRCLLSELSLEEYRKYTHLFKTIGIDLNAVDASNVCECFSQSVCPLPIPSKLLKHQGEDDRIIGALNIFSQIGFAEERLKKSLGMQNASVKDVVSKIYVMCKNSPSYLCRHS